MANMRKTLLFGLCFLALLAAACGGKSLSSAGGEEGGQRAAWYGEEEAMLQTMHAVGVQYAICDPASDFKGFTIIDFGRFSLQAELVPLGATARSEEKDASDPENADGDAPDSAPAAGLYGIRVSFERGLAEHEDLLEKIYADMVEAFDRKFPRG